MLWIVVKDGHELQFGTAPALVFHRHHTLPSPVSFGRSVTHWQQCTSLLQAVTHSPAACFSLPPLVATHSDEEVAEEAEKGSEVLPVSGDHLKDMKKGSTLLAASEWAITRRRLGRRECVCVCTKLGQSNEGPNNSLCPSLVVLKLCQKIRVFLPLWHVVKGICFVSFL